MRHIKYIDLFAGCGGLSFGLTKTGIFSELFAIERNSDAFDTLNKNLDLTNNPSWPSWLEKTNWDIIELIQNHSEHLRTLSGTVDVVVGGPPCQGFSLAGKRNHEDERNLLPNYYLKFISLVKPRFIFFENVSGFCLPFKEAPGNSPRIFSDELRTELSQIGYNTESRILNFSEYGIPQTRRRYILFGTRGDITIEPNLFFNRLDSKREQFLEEKGLGKLPISVKAAIGDLERKDLRKNDKSRFLFGSYTSSPQNTYQILMRINSDHPANHRFANHHDTTIEKFQEIVRLKLTRSEIQTHFSSKKKSTTLLVAEDSAPTLTTLPDDYIHYSEPRILTPREYARIQSFPDAFHFYGKYTTGGIRRKSDSPIYTQIGNAIPPLFAELVGEVIKEIINGI